MGEIIVRVLKLPPSIRGVTVIDENGDFNIYINKNLSPDEQKRVLEHEKRHIFHDDFASFEEIEHIEKRADGKLG